jgi:hypothetical protein
MGNVPSNISRPDDRAKSCRYLCGKDSSGRIFSGYGEKGLLQQFEQLFRLLSADSRKVIEEFIERLPGFEVIEQRLHG